MSALHPAHVDATLGVYDRILEPDTQATLILEVVFIKTSCGCCSAPLEAGSQVVMKADNARGIFAILCEACAPAHVAEQHRRALLRIADMERKRVFRRAVDGLG